MRKNLERYFAERREKKKTGNIRVTYEELLEQAAGNEERKLLEIRTGGVSAAFGSVCSGGSVKSGEKK